MKRASHAKPWVTSDRDHLRYLTKVTLYVPDVWVVYARRPRIALVLELVPWLFRIIVLTLFRPVPKRVEIPRGPYAEDGAGARDSSLAKTFSSGRFPPR